MRNEFCTYTSSIVWEEGRSRRRCVMLRLKGTLWGTPSLLPKPPKQAERAHHKRAHNDDCDRKGQLDHLSLLLALREDRGTR